MSTASGDAAFYLDGLLYCHGPMYAVTRRDRRLYRCGICRIAVDALSAEVQVWELARTQRPELGFWGTPYAVRRERLVARLRWARLLDGGRWMLRWAVPTRPYPS